MNRFRTPNPFHALALLLCAALVSCQALQDAAQVLIPEEKPTASVVGARLSDLSMDAVTLELDVKVDNPYSVSLPLSALSYVLSSDDRTLLSGNAAPSEPIGASSSDVIPLSLKVPFQDLLATLSGVRPGSVVDWAAAIELTVDAPVIGALTLPLEREGKLPIPAVPEVSLESVRWDELSLTQARATLELGVLNTNTFPIDLDELSFGVSLGGTKVADASAVPLDELASDQTGSLQIPISFSPLSLGSAALALFKGEGAAYGLQGMLSIGTPFGPITTPFDGSGSVPFLR
jgi:LEA14-like dessication related protein